MLKIVGSIVFFSIVVQTIILTTCKNKQMLHLTFAIILIHKLVNVIIYFRLTNYLRALGCRVSTRKATTPDKSSCHIATLPIPLTFPTLQPKKKKERR